MDIKRVAVLCFLIIVLLVLLVYYFFVGKVYFELKGNHEEIIKFNEDYKDPGISAKYCTGNRCDDLSDYVTIENNVDNTKLGTYEYVYYINYQNKKYKLTRKITVIDDESPIISLKGNSEINMCPNTEYKEEGYTATDNYDKDITDKVERIVDKNRIIYRVYDTSNNKAEKIRIIKNIDVDKPKFTLIGSNSISIQLNSNYIEPGYKALDNCDGDISSNVKIDSNVDTKKEGEYSITYSVTDSSGNTEKIKREVKVVKTSDISNKINNINDLDSYIRNNKYNISMIYYDIESGYTYKYKPDVIYFGASLIKTLDALYVYEKLQLTDELRNLVEPTIHKSDNITHKKLVDMIGRKKLKKYGESLGAKHVLDDNKTYDYYGYTNAEDQLIFMKHLWKVVNTNPNGEELKRYFINNWWNKLRFDGSPEMMYKYGLSEQYYHEVGIVLDEHPYIIIVLSKEAYNDYGTIVENISKKVYELHHSLYKDS